MVELYCMVSKNANSLAVIIPKPVKLALDVRHRDWLKIDFKQNLGKIDKKRAPDRSKEVLKEEEDGLPEL